MPEPTIEDAESRIPYELRIFEYLIAHAFDMVQILDPEGRTVFVSPSVTRVTGRGPQDIVGRDPIERVHPDDQPAVRELFEEIGRQPGGTSRMITARGLHADGTWRKLQCVVQNLTDDPAVGGLIVNYRDITNETEARDQLRRLKERYEKAFRNSPDSITISHVDDGRFLEVNEGFVKLTGYTAEDAVGRTAIEIGIWKDPDNRKQVILGLSHHNRVEDLEVDFVTRSGEVRKGQYSAEVVDIGGKPCLLAVTRDITEMKVATEKLKRASEELRHEHGEVTRKNVALEEVLDHLEQEKRAFRHELSANVENLLRPIVEKLRQAGGRLSAQEIEVLSNGLDAIVGNDLDQYENNLGKLTPREMDICALISKSRTSKEIAEDLGLSDQTIHKHRQSIRRKLQLDNRGINLAAYLRSRQR